MSKEEKIKEAWGNFYSPKINENGWLKIPSNAYSNNELFDRLKFNSETNSIRPKSISGIENNNGWIKIESENDLPKDSKEFHVVIFEGEIEQAFFDKEIERWYSVKNSVRRFPSHYKEIEVQKPPIY